ncbi:TM2 domain-containing protein [Senegalimassilia faecalis]|uniref:TM2 domain-containing protein n=1 Tax=Senegalimassilia faecalis TaxID=2509433 RepID=A0A4Q2JXT4_9ACTN|nr:TM2 domain-containing protein [Senegalimassilia faecalis]RXZ53736.1 TM2 domain-containing protein [Senegalimassilia faecalis]
MDSMNNRSAAEEVAAAEAEVRAAQARLDAARARMASEQATSPQVEAQPQQPYGTAQQQPPYTQPGQGTGAQPYVQPGQTPTGTQQPYGAQQPYAQPQPGAYGAPQNPYAQQYQQPYVAPTVGEKDHVAAGLLAIFLGWLGVHKFYLGYNTSGFIMLGVSVLGGIVTLSVAVWAIWVIAIVEGIFYLTKSQTEFEQMYVLNKREWF